MNTDLFEVTATAFLPRKTRKSRTWKRFGYGQTQINTGFVFNKSLSSVFIRVYLWLKTERW